MKNFVLGFLAMVLVLAVLTGGSLLYLRLGFAEVRNDAKAPAWERHLTKFAVKASVRRSATHVPGVPPHTEDDLIAGGKLYLNGCAGCHGRPGRPRRIIPDYLPPPQFANGATRYAEPELFWIVKHGIRRSAMSAYGPFYSDREIWDLAAFVQQMDHLPLAVQAGIQPKKP